MEEKITTFNQLVESLWANINKKRKSGRKSARKGSKAYKAAKKAGLPTKNITSALKMKKSPALAKLSASCKAAAKRKFKVYPSAYANMWAAKTQRQGKC